MTTGEKQAVTPRSVQEILTEALQSPLKVRPNTPDSDLLTGKYLRKFVDENGDGVQPEGFIALLKGADGNTPDQVRLYNKEGHQSYIPAADEEKWAYTTRDSAPEVRLHDSEFLPVDPADFPMIQFILDSVVIRREGELTFGFVSKDRFWETALIGRANFLGCRPPIPAVASIHPLHVKSFTCLSEKGHAELQKMFLEYQRALDESNSRMLQREMDIAEISTICRDAKEQIDAILQQSKGRDAIPALFRELVANLVEKNTFEFPPVATPTELLRKAWRGYKDLDDALSIIFRIVEDANRNKYCPDREAIVGAIKNLTCAPNDPQDFIGKRFMPVDNRHLEDYLDVDAVLALVNGK